MEDSNSISPLEDDPHKYINEHLTSRIKDNQLHNHPSGNLEQNKNKIGSIEDVKSIINKNMEKFIEDYKGILNIGKTNKRGRKSIVRTLCSILFGKRKDLVRIILIRGHTRMLKHAKNNRYTECEFIIDFVDRKNIQQNNYFKEIQNHFNKEENNKILNTYLDKVKMTYKDLNENKGYNKDKDSESLQSLNDLVCLEYFKDEAVRRSFEIFIDIVFEENDDIVPKLRKISKKEKREIEKSNRSKPKQEELNNDNYFIEDTELQKEKNFNEFRVIKKVSNNESDVLEETKLKKEEKIFKKFKLTKEKINWILSNDLYVKIAKEFFQRKLFLSTY